MARKSNKVLFWGIIGIVLLLLFLTVIFYVLSSVIQPVEKNLIQYYVNPEDVCIFVKENEGGMCGSINGVTTDYYSQSVYSNTATINTGKSTFKFESIKYGTTEPLGIIDPVNNRKYYACVQKTTVYKDNVQIAIIDSYSYDGISFDRDYWQGKTYNFSDDLGTQVSFKTAFNTQGKGNYDFYPDNDFANACKYFVNEYSILPSKEVFDLSATVDQSVKDKLKVNLNVKNNLAIPVRANLKVKFIAPSVLGTTEKTLEQSNTLNVGDNIIPFELDIAGDVSQVQIMPKADLLILGTNFEGLNYNSKNFQVMHCGGTYKDGSCKSPSPTTSDKPTKIDSTEWIPIGTIIGNTVYGNGTIDENPEICNNGIDDNGNGLIDEGCDKPLNYLLWVAIGVLTLFIIFIIIMIIRRKR